MKMHIPMLAAFTILVSAFAATLFAQHLAMPPGTTHEEHLAQVKKDAELRKRGAAAMGFDQAKTSHHFRLKTNGGSIEVGATDASDEETRSQVRQHLKEIAAEFASGNFAKPFATHGDVPPGVGTMQQRKKAIVYQYEDTRDGGRVNIETRDSKAKIAVHEFLRYQIREHATGDPSTAEKQGAASREPLRNFTCRPSAPPSTVARSSVLTTQCQNGAAAWAHLR